MRTLSTEGPNHWKLLSKRAGKVTGTEHWSISDDQKTLTIAAEGVREDGSSFKTETKAKRTAGKTGFAGAWEFTQFDPAEFTEWVIEPFGDDGLDFVTPSAKEHDRVKFDGKDYPNEGPRVPADTTTAGKRIEARTLEMTIKSKGKLTETDHLELSEDGKTMTVHMTFPSEEKKITVVLERE